MHILRRAHVESKHGHGVEVKRRDFAAHQPIERGAADHGGVVGAQSERRHVGGKAVVLAHALHFGAQQAVCGHAARHRDALHAGHARSLAGALYQCLYHAFAVGRGEVGAVDLHALLLELMAKVNRGGLYA